MDNVSIAHRQKEHTVEVIAVCASCIEKNSHIKVEDSLKCFENGPHEVWMVDLS